MAEAFAKAMYNDPPWRSGPKILDGSGESCDGVDIACREDLDDVALYLNDLPGVSTAFKKCMKGRLGCGGSSFRRLRIECAPGEDCGPCSYIASDGCNIGGSRLWYCDAITKACRCINIILHEASHSCGTLDLEDGSTYDSYRIGDWFEDEFRARSGLGPRCEPIEGIEPDPTDPNSEAQ